MRFIAIVLITLGVAIVWSALKGRSPLDEWQVFKDLITHQHTSSAGAEESGAGPSSAVNPSAGKPPLPNKFF